MLDTLSTRLLLGYFIMHRLTLAMINLCTKFEMPISIRFADRTSWA